MAHIRGSRSHDVFVWTKRYVPDPRARHRVQPPGITLPRDTRADGAQLSARRSAMTFAQSTALALVVSTTRS
jgi:hypothetical protein